MIQCSAINSPAIMDEVLACAPAHHTHTRAPHAHTHTHPCTTHTRQETPLRSPTCVSAPQRSAASVCLPPSFSSYFSPSRPLSILPFPYCLLLLSLYPIPRLPFSLSPSFPPSLHLSFPFSSIRRHGAPHFQVIWPGHSSPN